MKYKGKYIETSCKESSKKVDDPNKPYCYKTIYICNYCGKEIDSNQCDIDSDDPYPWEYPCCDCEKAKKEISIKKKIINLLEKADKMGINIDDVYYS